MSLKIILFKRITKRRLWNHVGGSVFHEENNTKTIIKSRYSSSTHFIFIFYLLLIEETHFSLSSFQFSTISVIPLYNHNNKYYYACAMLGCDHFSAGWSNIPARHIKDLIPLCHKYFLFTIRKQFHILFVWIQMDDAKFWTEHLSECHLGEVFSLLSDFGSFRNLIHLQYILNFYIMRK